LPAKTCEDYPVAPEGETCWYNLSMVGQKPKRTLPAGVLPAKRAWSDDDPASRVRAKAPRPTDAPDHSASSDREPPSRTPPSRAETHAERARRLVDQLTTLGPNEVAPIIRRLLPLGNFALEELARSFPGPLWRPAMPTDSRLPRPEEISASAVALAAFDVEAVPYLTRLMRSSSSQARYYATIMCSACDDTELVAPLAQVALDDDRECRRVALHLLRAYQHQPIYGAALGELRRCASDVAGPLHIRRRAISALTQLRDEQSAALFVDLLADSDRAIGTASRVGLRVLTAHDFGFSRDPWLRWLSDRRSDSRIQWLIEGLGDGRANIRLLASRELWRLTRLLRPLSEIADRDEFSVAQRQYERWWTKNHGD
jgi:HEAT repeat protein